MHFTILVAFKFQCFVSLGVFAFLRSCRVSALCTCAKKWWVPRLSIQPLLWLIGNGDLLCRGRDFPILDFWVETRNVCGFCENKQQTNACVSVTRFLFESHNSENQFSRPQINFHDSRPTFRAFSWPGTKFSNSGAFPIFLGPWEPWWHENGFLINGPLWGESNCNQWIPLINDK